MEVTGLTIGVVGLAGLFNVCLDSLSRFQSYRSSNSETNVLDTRFRAARTRFEQWGASVGISQGRLQQKHHPGLDNKQTTAVIEDILRIIAKTICDDGILHRNRTEPRLQNGHFGGPPQSRSKRLKWALRGKEDRIEQVDIFEKLVQQLYNLVPPDSKDDHCEGLENTAWAEDIRQMLTKIEEGMKSEIRRYVYSWLGKSPPNDKYEDSLGKRVDTTCEWIFDRPTFKSWLSPDASSMPSLLWINGPAGFGKTILCAHIVEHLSETLDTPVAYFFFTSDHQSREDPFFALRSWISQVAAQNDSAFEAIRQVWESDSSEVASRRALVDLFKEIVTAVPGCLFIADGLDECSQLGTGDSSVARFLRDIMKSSVGTDVRLLLISRDEPEIREVLEESQDFFSEYRIGTDDVEADTAVFSQSVVDRKLPNKSEDIRSSISEAMTERCQGQFLWIKMQEESLRKGMSKKRLHEIVENTPTGLDRLYDHNWERIMNMTEWDRHRAFAILRWAAFAYWPLTVYQITEAVLISQFEELDTDEYPENIDDDYIKTEIVGLCGPLLEVRDDPEQSSPRCRTLHIPHFSVRQYLVDHLPIPTWIQANNSLQKDYEKVHYTVMAKACVQYLNLSQVWEKEDDDPDPPHNSFLLHAACTWMQYAKLGFLDPSLVELSKAFLSKDNNHFKSLVNYLAKLRPFEYVFYGGWIDMAGHLIDEADINEIGSRGRSPIFSACSAGSAELVNMLIRRGANLSITDFDGFTCLHYAAACGFEDNVKIFVESGVDLSPQDHHGRTPLHIAALHGHRECFQYLIERGADINMKDTIGSTVTHHACVFAGRAEVLRYILQNGPDTLATDSLAIMGSPLHLVSMKGDVEMAKVLFEHGAVASLFALESHGVLPLHLAVSLGHIELVKLFLQHGAERTLSTSTASRWTPLHYACGETGREEIISLLLRPGVEQSLLMGNDVGNTPLHVASSQGHASYVKLILQYQEPEQQHLLEARNEMLETPLFVASSFGHINVVRQLLNYGAQTTLSILNEMDYTPLFTASFNGHSEVVKTLLDHGAETTVSIFDNLNNSPLWAASFRGSTEVVEALLSHGAGMTIATPNSAGETPLYAAATCDHVEIVKLLLEVPDVPVNEKTVYGITPLFVAARNGNLKTVEVLLNGDTVDIDCENWLGLTPMFAAVANGHLEVTELLISKGATMRRWVSIGQDLLWWARRSNNQDLVQLLETQEALTEVTTSEIQHPPPGPYTTCEPLPHNAGTIVFEPGIFWCYVCTLSVEHQRNFDCNECDSCYMFLCSECYDRGFHLSPRSHRLVSGWFDESDSSGDTDGSDGSEDS
ncbi:hypothetical protein IL306_008754 [Fusarium sp. DS 682]|nr:hypothetical protein IL306_008754 [Fusarium sp. DS 682]